MSKILIKRLSLQQEQKQHLMLPTKNFADFKYLKQMLLESQTLSVVHLKYSNMIENVLLTSRNQTTILSVKNIRFTSNSTTTFFLDHSLCIENWCRFIKDPENLKPLYPRTLSETSLAILNPRYQVVWCFGFIRSIDIRINLRN